MQAFLCELYIYVTDEMHVGLNRVLAVEDERPVPSPLTTTVQLKHFAREAEVNGNFCLAAKYYQEVGWRFWGVDTVRFSARGPSAIRGYGGFWRGLLQFSSMQGGPSATRRYGGLWGAVTVQFRGVKYC